MSTKSKTPPRGTSKTASKTAVAPKPLKKVAEAKKPLPPQRAKPSVKQPSPPVKPKSLPKLPGEAEYRKAADDCVALARKYKLIDIDPADTSNPKVYLWDKYILIWLRGIVPATGLIEQYEYPLNALQKMIEPVLKEVPPIEALFLRRFLHRVADSHELRNEFVAKGKKSPASLVEELRKRGLIK